MTAILKSPILDFHYKNNLWTTTTCQQQALFLGPKNGRCTKVWLYYQRASLVIQKKYVCFIGLGKHLWISAIIKIISPNYLWKLKKIFKAISHSDLIFIPIVVILFKDWQKNFTFKTHQSGLLLFTDFPVHPFSFHSTDN